MTGATLLQGGRIVTPIPPGSVATPYLRGPEAGRLRILPEGDVLLAEGRVVAMGPSPLPLDAWTGSGGEGVDVVELGGRVVLPGFVDAHTHACWSGDRLDEWEARLRGAGYEEILAGGGGIHSTVRATREASLETLVAELVARGNRALSLGTTTLEVKSGYGLLAEAELRMLEAIERAGAILPQTLVPTALLGHALAHDAPGGPEAFPAWVVRELLPQVTARFPGVAVDAFCEAGAWSPEACMALFEAAREAGHPVRVHADQFRDLGMTQQAVALGARSVDHLEASTSESLEALARSETAGVLLPVSGFHLDGRWARGRELVDRGGAVVVATNWNPGSAPSPSLPLAVALAVRRCGLTVPEALVAVTWNAAVLLGFRDRGWIGEGARADLVVLKTRDEREVAHTVGENPVESVWVEGRREVGGQGERERTRPD